MRFVIAAVLFILSSALILLGLAERTVLAPPSQYSASIELKQKAPYVVIPNSVLSIHPGVPKISATNEGPAFIAAGRESDIVAFVGKSTNLTVSADKATKRISNTLVPGFEASVTPTNSDLWRAENSGAQKSSLIVSPKQQGAALIASNGVDSAPGKIEILWQVPLDFTIPTVMIWVGLVMLLGAAILTFLTYRRMRINRGPRRKTPKPPKPPKYRYRSTVVAPKRGRRAARGFIAITSTGLTLTLLTGCTSSTSLATPSPTNSAARVDQVSLLSSQVTRIISDVAVVARDADASNDKRILIERFTGPALQVRDINYQLRLKSKRIAALPAIVGKPIRFSLPAATSSWPRQLMVVTDEPGAAALPQMLVLQQDTPRSKYQVWFTSRLMPGAKIPAVPASDIGAIPIDSGSLFLKIQPKNIPTTFGDVLNSGAASLSSPLFDLDNEFFKQVSQAQKAQATQLNNANITYTHKLGDPNVISLATSDGGALVAVYQTDIYTIKPKKANSAVGVSGQEAMLLGANGSTRGVQSTYGDMLFFYVPPVADKSKIKLIGATQGLVSVRSL
ncbi:MAG: hypothetical protein RLZZ471_789 [Actinomycetota bacterium]|jgi:hypothetical protein